MSPGAFVMLIAAGVALLAGVLGWLAWHPWRRLAASLQLMHRTGGWTRMDMPRARQAGTVVSAMNALVDEQQELRRRLHVQQLELQHVSDELQQVLHLKDDFLSTVNHQFRTPLTAMLEGIELLQDGAVGPVSEEQRGLLGMLSSNTRRLTALTEDLLDLGELKSGRQTLQREPADLDALLVRTASAWEPLADGRILRVYAARLPRVYMDAEAIGRVLNHLVRNALRHAPQRSEVTVRAEARDGQVEVCVRDCGPGLSQAQLGQLFQPFAHLHTPDAPGAEGSGLGLAYCAQMIGQHRGTLRADSSPGAGMAITFTLPVATEAFLLEEACRLAQEEAETEEGSFALLLAAPAGAPPAAGEPLGKALHRLGSMLQCRTHRGDRFVPLAGLGLAIVAVTDERGLQAMTGRLRGVLERAGLEARLGAALAPVDGASARELLDVARQRLERRDAR